MLLREGNLKAMKRILSYLKIFAKGRFIIDISYPDHSVYPTEDHSKWVEFYPDSGEEFPRELPPEKGTRVKITVYVHADHAYDLVTRRCITGILVIINNKPIIWKSRRQKTVETSTYGSLLVTTELILEVMYKLLSLGVAFNVP
jgi:hypothetical protein